MIIRPITADQTLPLRRVVLWPNHPVEASMVKGDASAIHFGGFVNDTLICTASLFPNGDDIRLRKFATDPALQGQGHGSALLKHLIEYANAQGVQNFWFDARKSAVPFYQRFGFQVEGSVFFKKDVAYLRMTREIGSP